MTIPPIKTSIIGSIIRTRTSSFRSIRPSIRSAILTKTSSSVLDSSATRIMAMTCVGISPLAASGFESESPAVTFSADLSIASASKMFPVDSLLIRKDLSKGTPFFNMVPNTRQALDTAASWKMSPTSGVLSLTWSTMRRPRGVLIHRMMPKTTPARAKITINPYCIKTLLAPKSTMVIKGKPVPFCSSRSKNG